MHSLTLQISRTAGAWSHSGLARIRFGKIPRVNHAAASDSAAAPHYRPGGGLNSAPERHQRGGVI